MSLIGLLPLVPGLPLLGVVALVLGGRWLPSRAAGWLATLLVAAAFLLTVGIGAEFRTVDAAGHLAASADGSSVIVPVWQWLSAGEDLVEVTVASRELPPLEAIPAAAVGRGWLSAHAPGLAEALGHMWDPDAVIGQRPVAVGPVPAGQLLTDVNIPPAEVAMVTATPRRQHRFAVDVALQLDGLSLLMMLLVTGVGGLIHLYSIGYMQGDSGQRRYFTYLNLFICSMLVLVTAANFLVLFVGWELVGLCSYLLIGFWFTDPANVNAGRKAFIVNRIGDFAFLLGLMLIWTTFGSLAYSDVLDRAAEVLPLGGGLAVSIAALLLVGATGKSAQLPLFVWLPDAMAGPTPVSALIHAATMVTAGVYMIARAHALFEQAPMVLAAVAIIGTLTALLAAVIAVVQVDIKRLLAYSTISQLGYMFLAVGAGAYVAALFHLMTHAFFKALLFLGAGSVIHALEHGMAADGAHPEPVDGVPAQQDMRQMGGLLAQIPLTGWSFVIGALALAGIFPLAGFWSKDEILFKVLAHDGGPYSWLWPVLWAAGLVTAFLTALYIGRALLMTLAGAPRSAAARQAHRYDEPTTMAVPLLALAALALAGGLPGIALGQGDPLLGRLLGAVLVETHHVDGPSKVGLAVVASLVAVSGLAFAWLAYGPRPALDPARVVGLLPLAYRSAWRKFYVDEAYAALFVRPFRVAADFLWHVVDDDLVDGVVNGIGRGLVRAGQWSRHYQTGYVRHYALSMLLGAVVIALYLFLTLR